ncbi:MAG: hypothetical protein AB1642_07960 [Pseudomonadota bacterium]
MSSNKLLAILCLAALLAGCVNVHVHFPEAGAAPAAANEKP